MAFGTVSASDWHGDVLGNITCCPMRVKFPLSCSVSRKLSLFIDFKVQNVKKNSQPLVTDKYKPCMKMDDVVYSSLKALRIQ